MFENLRSLLSFQVSGAAKKSLQVGDQWYFQDLTATAEFFRSDFSRRPEFIATSFVPSLINALRWIFFHCIEVDLMSVCQPPFIVIVSTRTL